MWQFLWESRLGVGIRRGDLAQEKASSSSLCPHFLVSATTITLVLFLSEQLLCGRHSLYQVLGLYSLTFIQLESEVMAPKSYGMNTILSFHHLGACHNLHLDIRSALTPGRILFACFPSGVDRLSYVIHTH